MKMITFCAAFVPPPIPANVGKIPVTLHLTPRQLAMVQEMAENDEHACVEDAILHDLRSGVVEFYSCYGGPKAAVVLEAWNSEGDPTQLVTVTLDEHASAEARRCLEGNPHAPVDHLSDLVNAAVGFFADDTDQGKTTHDFVEEAKSRRLAAESNNAAPIRPSLSGPGSGHAVTIRLSPVQLRMFMQVADDSAGGTMAEIVRRELGQHVALHLECYHGHELDAARQRWAREGEEVA